MTLLGMPTLSAVPALDSRPIDWLRALLRNMALNITVTADYLTLLGTFLRKMADATAVEAFTPTPTPTASSTLTRLRTLTNAMTLLTTIMASSATSTAALTGIGALP